MSDTFEDLDIHQKLMMKLDTAVDNALKAIDKADGALEDLNTHNGSPTAHQDIRSAIADLSAQSVTSFSSMLQGHNSAASAHPALVSALEASIKNVKTAAESSATDLRSLITDELNKVNSSLNTVKEDVTTLKFACPEISEKTVTAKPVITSPKDGEQIGFNVAYKTHVEYRDVTTTTTNEAGEKVTTTNKVAFTVYDPYTPEKWSMCQFVFQWTGYNTTTYNGMKAFAEV